MGARDALDAQPGGDQHPDAVVCLSHRFAVRLGRGSTAQSGKERDGGMIFKKNQLHD